MQKQRTVNVLLSLSVVLLMVMVLVPPACRAESKSGVTADTGLEGWKSRALKAEDELSKLRARVEKSKPKLPVSAPVTLDAKTTALMVLDLSNRCKDPAQVCSQLVPRITDFLGKTRAAKVFTLYTVSAKDKDKPQGRVWDNFNVPPDEVVIAPDSIDKFFTGELQPILQRRGIKSVIVTGASTNNAVFYTATSAARMFGYQVVIPTDGVIAKTSYESEYPLYQFSVLASGANKRFFFTTLGGISFSEK